VAPSDAKDDEFSGNANFAATMKMLQEISPQINQLLNEQERLTKQMKQMRLLLLLALFFAIALPFYFMNHLEKGSDQQSCSISSSSL